MVRKNSSAVTKDMLYNIAVCAKVEGIVRRTAHPTVLLAFVKMRCQGDVGLADH
jgi:hypothetical protein